MSDPNELIAEVRRMVLKRAEKQIERHQRAGHEISRSQAIDMAVRDLREHWTRSADKLESEGKGGDNLRELAAVLPDLLRELGVR